jgi:hypothetical protein
MIPSDMRRLCALITLLLFLSGCASSGPGQSGIEELHLFGLPVAVNMDSRPGADGFSVRVYASGTKEARGLVVRNGTLEILLFDGAFQAGEVPSQPPLRVWPFTADQLEPLASRNRLGVGYEFTLAWAGSPPTGKRITVYARYIPAGSNSRAILSGPASISVNVR